jgi:zinc D-Ala-D-Ala dipeptidase
MHAIWMLLLAAADPLPDLVDVRTLDPRFLLDIKYATSDNFIGKQVYPEARCLLVRSVAEKVVAAQRWLDAEHAGLRLMFKDCYRPHSVQLVMWDAVKGTPKARYVANPHTKVGSIHSYGAAVDLTLADAAGRELDMGTPYDHLGELAEPRHEAKFLGEGKLTKAQLRNRRILRTAMRESGMHGLLNEWWHFNEHAPEKIRNKYRRLDVPFSAFPANDRKE